MAKVAFTKLGLKKDDSIKELEWNGQKIEIKQFLSTEDKLNLISNIINYSADNHVFYNPCKIEIFETIEIILKYTNINLTDKQSEDVLKLYDLFISSNFKEKIFELIPKQELDYIHNGIYEAIKEIYRYRDSFMGVMEQTQADYKNLDEQIENITDKIQDPNNLTLLKDVVTKLN